MKKKIFSLTLVMIACSTLIAQAPIYDSTRVYDTITDDDPNYLYYTPKPCLEPSEYMTAPGMVWLQEYVPADTVTVYGVAATITSWPGWTPYSYADTGLCALLMSPTGPSWGYYYGMQPIDTVTLNRAQPRFYWFLYEDDCNEKQSQAVPCYEFYFDTPKPLANQMTDTFYVGIQWDPSSMTTRPIMYGGLYDNALPWHMFMGPGNIDFGNANEMYVPMEGSYEKLWGVFFPIIGFRCTPLRHYSLDSYTDTAATVSWSSREIGGFYEVRLVGEDGSDTTFFTPDTSLTFHGLSDSVRYNVMVRKQCHYATSNYDTTVYSDWLTHISFGTTILPDTVSPGDTLALQQSDFVYRYTALQPNPASGTVTLSGLPEGSLIELYDLRGRLVKEFKIQNSEFKIDVSALTSGTYLLRITTPAGTTTKKLLIQ